MAVVKEKEKKLQEDSVGNQSLRRLHETWAELEKVVWPGGPEFDGIVRETSRLTMVVIGVSTAIGFFLFLSDSLFLTLYTLLVKLVQP